MRMRNENLFLESKALKVDLHDANTSLSSLEEKSHLTLLSFHQVQQELEQYFLRPTVSDSLHSAQEPWSTFRLEFPFWAQLRLQCRFFLFL